MNKKLSKIMVVVMLCVICSIGALAIPSATKAASPKSGVKKIGTDFTNFVTYRLFYEMKKGDSETYTFSKTKDRQTVLKYCQACADQTPWKKVSSRLFGKATPAKKVLIGEWGLDHPYFTIDKIKKLGGGKYKVTMIQMNQDRETKERTRLGVTTYTIKKNSKSAYGYVVTRLNIKSEYDK